MLDWDVMSYLETREVCDSSAQEEKAETKKKNP
jgi:hypothetical protein